MKKIGFVIALIFFVSVISGCSFHYESPEEVHQFFDGIAKDIGASQITKEEELIGKRQAGEDSYTGVYKANCEGSTGKDVIFGGASIDGRKLYVHGLVHSDQGKATIRVRRNWEVTELIPDENGYFETELSMDNGGNYIMVSYEMFEGIVEIVSEYSENKE